MTYVGSTRIRTEFGRRFLAIALCATAHIILTSQDLKACQSRGLTTLDTTYAAEAACQCYSRSERRTCTVYGRLWLDVNDTSGDEVWNSPGGGGGGR